MSQQQENACPLCHSNSVVLFFSDRREFFRCNVCQLVFVPPAFFLSLKEEKAEYDLHENSPEDVRYRQFLCRMFEPVNARISPASCGLDFGSGPGPTLSVMFEEAGHTMEIYDPFYATETSVLQRTYDFITATEVVEHLHHPAKEFARMWNMLKPGGWFGVMTQLVIDRDAFSRWRYKDDRTHVAFYSRKTFQWLAAQWQASLNIIGSDVALFHKP